MATYTETFSGQTTGANSTTFTNRWATETSISVENPAIGEQDSRVLRFTTGDSTALRLQSMDAVDSDGTRDNCEIVARVRVTEDDDNNFYLIGRASGSSGSEAGYVFYLNGFGNLAIARYNSGSGTSLNSVDSETVLSAWKVGSISSWTACPTNQWLYLRFRINGTGATVTLQAKVWTDSTQEPSDWLLTASDTDANRITTAGWVGVGRWNNTGTVYWDAVGVGTNGDTAPIPTGSANLRLTTANAVAMVTNNATPVRLTTTNATAMVTNNATPVRLSTMNVSVMMKRIEGGGLGPVVVSIMM